MSEEERKHFILNKANNRIKRGEEIVSAPLRALDIVDELQESVATLADLYSNCSKTIEELTNENERLENLVQSLTEKNRSLGDQEE